MSRSTATAPQVTQRGISLIESVVALAVIAVTLGAALPSLKAARERRHLEGAAAQLATDIRHARSLAVAQRAPVRLSVQQTSEGACYVIHTGRAGDCRCSGAGAASCSGSAQALRTVAFGAGLPVSLSTSSASMLFDPDRGTVTPTGTLKLALSNGNAIHHVVNIMGRARSCSPGATMPGYPAC